MKQLMLEITNPVGLHARPAALFVKCTKTSQSIIRVRNGTKSGKWVDGKSILGVLTLGVQKGHTIEITFEGPDEEKSAEALKQLVDSDFSEPDQDTNPV